MAACALFAGGVTASAQEDVTSTYLTNADLSTVDNGWTYYSDTFKYTDWKTDGDVPVVEFYSQWNQGASVSITQKDFKFSQSVTLPAGDYRIAVNAFYRNGGGDGTNDNKAWIFAGDKKQNVYALTSAGVSSYTGSSDLYKAANAFSRGDFSNAFDFSLTEETTIDLGFQGFFNTSLSWCILGPVKLYKYSLDDYLSDYDAKYAEAQALDGKPMNASVQTALTAAMVDKSTFTLVSEVTAAIATLTTAVNNATNSVNSYAAIKTVMDKAELFDSYGTAAYEACDGVTEAIAAYNNGTATDGATEIAAFNAAFNTGVLATKQPGNGLDMTAYITNPTIDGADGWTTERPLGGNGPLLNNTAFEYWAGNASDRTSASFNYYQNLNNLPTGVYTVSADMFNSLNGEGGDYTVFSATCGVYGTSSNEEVALVTTEGGTLNTYTTGNVLVFSGKMTIGVKNTVTPIAARWFSADNFKLTYVRQLTAEEIAANTVPESISLAPTSATITIYGNTTLTPTILPDNANDKTVTWTSSNEAVATVSNGVVTAVGVGTATITATANGADDVTATATITVSDVTPAAAPSFYSAIAAGDYYIMNAATGKFLGGANDWGTHASIIEHGIPFTVAVSDGKYTLDSHTYNNANSHFVSGAYIDGASATLYIQPVADGKYTISSGETSGYYSAYENSTYVDLQTVNPNSALAQWYFLSKADRDKMLAAATAGNPADATYYIKEANFGRNLAVTTQNTTAWTGTMTKAGDNTNFNAQIYNTTSDVYQTIENIPNGTYTVKVQAATSGSATFYANSEEVAVTTKGDEVTDQATASTAFSAGNYVNTLSVTVTDRTLKVGVKNADNAWVVFDNFELLMTEYLSVTALAATFDVDDDDETEGIQIEEGKTGNISVTITPTPASFDALTYTSSDEAVATVSDAGVVTAVAEGTATITIAAEMEAVTTTLAINVVKPAVIPSTVTLNETTVALTESSNSTTLTATVGAEGAPQTVVWTSSDETVATVADGVVTGVLPGTATIRATAYGYDDVYAEATVTVTYPESTVPASYYENDNATRTVYTISENMIKNGSFEYPNQLYGWTASNNYTTAAQASNFTITSTGGVNDGTYITGNGVGATNEKSLTKLIAVEAGKTYYFSVYTSGKAPNTTNQGYNALFKLTNAKVEDGVITKFNWPQGADQTTTEWSKTEYTFTADSDHPYVGIRLSWAASAKFDEFVLAEVTSTTEGNVDYATAAIPTANIGTGAFQIPQSAIDAANALVQGTATVEQVQAAYNAVTTLNVPEETQAYNLVFNCDGHSADGNALTLIPNPSQTQGLYGLKYLAPANVNLAQAFYFVHTTGNKYKVYAVDTDGNDRYITTQAEGYNTTWYEGIRTITDDSKAMEIEVRPNGEGLYLLWNTGANKAIAHNGNSNNDMFTANTANFQFVATTKPNITINTTAAGYGTTMLPFAQALPEGVKAYTCAEVSGNTLTLASVDALEANKPYIIEGSWNATVTGDAQGTALTYTDGLLTGTYTQIAAPNESYILQNQSGKVGFYQVDTEVATPNVPANRAYLTAPTTGARPVAFFFDSEATGINAINALSNGEAEIYNQGGVKQNKLQKGMNIIRSNGKTYKVVVK